MKNIINVFKKYAVFSGRSSVAEFWSFMSVHLIIIFVLGSYLYKPFVSLIFNNDIFVDENLYYLNGLLKLAENYDKAENLYGFFLVYVILTLLPTLSVTVRRLHDVGKSGFWILISLIPVPFIGSLILLAFVLQNGQIGTNKYGPNPKDLKTI